MNYKDYLDKARIKQLAELQERYNQVYAKERAEAASSLLAGHRQLRRGLQNVGLASRKGNLISGREKTAALEARRRYREYNTGLNRAASTFTTAAGQRMAHQVLDEQNRKERADAYKKWGDEYTAAVAQAQAEYNAKLDEAKTEHLNYAQEYQQNYDDYKAQLAAYQQQLAQYHAWLQQQAAAQAAQQGAQQELIDPRFQGNNMQQAKQDLLAARADQQRIQQAMREEQLRQDDIDPRFGNNGQSKLNLMQRQYAQAQARVNAAQTAYAAAQAQYAAAQAKLQQAQKISEPRTSKDFETLREAQYAQQQMHNLKNEMEALRLQAEQEQNAKEWQKKIQKGEGITKPKTRNEFERMQDAKRAQQKWIDSERKIQAARNPYIADLITLSDSEFAMRYDAAEKAYKQAVQNAQILRKDSSSSMDDLSSDANDIEAKATAEFVKWQQAAQARDNAMSNYYNDSVKTDMSLAPQAPVWASITNHNGANFQHAVDHKWDATDYAKNHNTYDSKYTALVNEWSLINGRTALNYTQTHALAGAGRNILSGGKEGQQYDAFVASCGAVFYNAPEGLEKVEREQMEALLTLANLMTDEERARFNTILKTNGSKDADKYFEFLYNSVLPQRFDEYTANENAFQARDSIGRIGVSIVSVPVNLAQSIPGVIHTLSTAQNDPVAAKLAAAKYNLAQNARNQIGQQYSNIVTAGTANLGKGFSEWAGNAANFLYGTGMSMADSATVAMISGGIGEVLEGAGVAAETATRIGSAIGGTLLGGSAFNASYSDALNNGLTPKKARWTAVGNGLNEMVFETLSIGTLLEKTGKSVLKPSKNAWVNLFVNSAVQAGVEGSEEVFTDIGNKIWDNKINGVFSEEVQKLREYVAQGMSFEEAKAKVNREFAEQLGMSFLGGAISGGFMGSGAQVIYNFQMHSFEKIGNNMSNETKQDIGNFDFKSEQAQEILNSEKITDQEYGVLWSIRQQELLEQYHSDIQQAVKDGKITEQDAQLLNKYEQGGMQNIAAEDFAQVQAAISKLDSASRIQFLDNEQAREFAEAVGSEVAGALQRNEKANAEASRQYNETVAAIKADTTLTAEQKRQKIEEAKQTRANAQSAAASEFDKTWNKGKGKLTIDGNTVKTAKGSGTVTFDFSIEGHNTLDTMTAKEQAALRIAQVVASRGVNVKVESEFTGEHRNENGRYDRETQTIHVNLAGDNSVLYTVSHELTHHLANVNAQAYSDLRNAIRDELKKSDISASELERGGFAYDLDNVVPYIDKTENLWDALVQYEAEQRGYGENAEEEVIARCCESFLANDVFIQSFAKKNFKSAKAIASFMTQLSADMNQLFTDADIRAAQTKKWINESPEQQILSQVANVQEIAQKWSRAVNTLQQKRVKAEGMRASKKNEVSASKDNIPSKTDSVKSSDLNSQKRFSMKDSVERKGDLIAVHNLSGDQLLKSFELGGFPMPSIAVMKQSQGHTRYGDVSVIFGKDTINPKKSTANKVYGGDAWTPTYPTVEYKPRKTVADRISKTYFNIARQYGYDAARPLYSYVYELERKLNNAGSEKALLDDLYNDIDMMRLYGQINGKERVEDVYQETRTEMSDTDKAVPQYLINALGEDFIRGYATPEGENPFQHRKEFIAKHIKELDRVFGKMLREEFSFDEAQMLNVVENMTTREYMAQLQRALKIVNNNTVKIDRVYDKGGTEKAVRNSIDEKAYKEWLYDLFHGIIEKSGIRNNKSYYTDMGNQRSWDALHYDETLENVVRVMRNMSDKGSNTFFSQSEMLALGTRNFMSIDDIREHKEQLQHISDEEMSAAKTNIVNQFGDLMDEMRDKSESNYFIGRDRALQAMVEAVRRSRTPQGILNELKQWHGLNVTDDMGRRIADLMDEIADLPTEYFEAKPRRAVGIDEIKAVIMPTGEYADLKSKLDERGIPVVEYEKDNDEDRLRALNSDEVSKSRFSTMDKVFRMTESGTTRKFELGEAKAQMIGNTVDLKGGTQRQRVAMMQQIADRYERATVDAANEAEAKAFERAGAQRIADSDTEYGTFEFRQDDARYKTDSQFDAKQKAKFAREVLKQIGSRRNFTDAQMTKYRNALERTMGMLWEATHGKGDQMAAFDATDRLFDRMLDNYSALTEADAEMRDALLENMPKQKDAKGRTYRVLEVTATQMSEIKSEYDNARTYSSKLSNALGTRVFVKQAQNAKTLEDIFTHSTDSRINSETVEGDMPNELLRLAEQTKEQRTNPYKGESDERNAVKESMWDAALNIVGGEKTTVQKVREAVKEARADERKAAKDKLAKAVDNARLAERMHEGALRAKDRRVMAERESDLKRRSVDREARLKQKFRETTARTNEERLKRDMRKMALKWNQRLVKMLANPTEASHIPVQLAQEVAAFTKTLTEYLDNGTQRGQVNLERIMKAYDEAVKADANIQQMTEAEDQFKARGEEAFAEGLFNDVELRQDMEELNKLIKDKDIKDLNPFELRELLDVVRGVAYSVYNANRMIGQKENIGVWTVRDQMAQDLKKVKVDQLNIITRNMLDFRRMMKIISGSNENAVLVQLANELNEGAIEKERIALALKSMFDSMTQKYGEEIRKWYGKDAEWINTGITFNGKKVEITKGMRVALALHVLNEGNMRHIENGGLTIPNRELYRKGDLANAYTRGQTVVMTAEQVDKILSGMTKAEKEYVKVAAEFFHERAGYYINRTSLQLLGYRKAKVENYFPIHTNRDYTKTDFVSVMQSAGVEGWGSLKDRIEGASNAIYLEDITSVINRQIDGVSMYAGLAIPMRNWNAVMNASSYVDGQRMMGKAQLGQVIKSEDMNVIKGFLADLTESTKTTVTMADKWIGRLSTNYVKAVLLGNLKVAMKQVASYPTAAAVIPWKYLNKALVAGGKNNRLISRADVDLINQYTPLYQMRREGNATEIASIMQKRGLEQKMPWLLGWITKMDVMTVGRLWSAAEYMVADQQKNLPVGSDEYYKAVAKVFNDTIQQTQPNFTPLQRGAALRSKNPVVRSLVLFGTQRMQNGNILLEAAYELRDSKGKSEAEIKAAKQKLGRAVASQVVQNILLIVASLGVDALRGRMKGWQDDDKEITPESLAKGMGDMFLSNLCGSFLGGSEVYDLISSWFKGDAYDTEFTVPALEAAEFIINFLKKDLKETVQYLTSGTHTVDEKLKKAKSSGAKLVKAAGYATGIPFENAYKDLMNGIIPMIKDLEDWSKTGELIPYLHQSGKLDNKKTSERYKEWISSGRKGSEFFYWQNKLNGVSKRDDRIAILAAEDIPNDDKAMLTAMFDTSGAYAEGTKLFRSNGKLYHDFANAEPASPVEQTLEDIAEATAAPTVAPTAEPTATPVPLSDKKMEGVQEAVKKGVPEELAVDAFLAYQDIGKQSDYDDDWSRNDQFREWLFANVADPNQRAILEYQVVGQATRVEGAVTYRATGTVYRDFTNESWYELSGWNLAKDGTNKRYEAGKLLEQTGMSVDKTVEIYRGLADYTKKAEWTNYMREQGLTDEQINIILWSRGWAKR